ncbi:hypothetical protein B0H13DRAFT_2358908 [Mycena leptocephala]|nr:hypothetical protein B0H13DRAFT_2358908 [Mycena leptocephala]
MFRTAHLQTLRCRLVVRLYARLISLCTSHRSTYALLAAAWVPLIARLEETPTFVLPPAAPALSAPVRSLLGLPLLIARLEQVPTLAPRVPTASSRLWRCNVCPR